ncbi:Probable ABC transporter ATP-binding protein HI_0664 [Dermatophilus congolensis]|uniref:Probable ABC transporter ATP-binding protein HI_0664 n=1 Tax=Dermatophilus congolensis TaxID=1863 RepID=A0AA46H151_9MICO|nr:thiol reductant ABC exporter subunit CydC [Dermatophilus congolensis]STD13357.1 Probable ABC transporter ATP-binding protein HI_0664 [Dermatophilus congolensis]
MNRRIVPGITGAAFTGGLALSSGLALSAASGWLIVAASFKPPILTLLAVIVLVRAFGIARPLLRYVERIRSHDAALAQLAEERTRAYRALIPLTPARLGRRGRGDILASIVEDLDDVVMAQIRVVVPIVSLLVTGAVAALVGAVFLFSAAAVVVGTVVACALVGFLDHLIEKRTQGSVVAARARVYELATTITTHADQLTAIGGTGAMLARLRQAEDRLTFALQAQAAGRAVGACFAPVITVAGAIAMAQVVTPYIDRGLPTPVAALLVLIPIALGEAVGAIPDAMGALARAQAARARLGVILNQTPAVAAEETALAAEKAGISHEEPAAPVRDVAGISLAVRDLTASWDGKRTALPALTTSISPGTFLAITGPNGSGKSTFLAVLARHLDPSSGVYLQDGADVLGLPLTTTRAAIAVVDDETHILASTLRENLRFTCPGADDVVLVDALRRAGLGGWFEGLPEGLDTRLGAGGQGVSGGERTRLGIARALASGRALLLLDEPTAHLDHPTAVAVLADVRAAQKDQTVVLVSHRSEGVAEADAQLELGSVPVQGSGV